MLGRLRVSRECVIAYAPHGGCGFAASEYVIAARDSGSAVDCRYAVGIFSDVSLALQSVVSQLW